MKFRINKKTFEIKSAEESDAKTLRKWWNDGKIMEHAGFPLGLGITLDKIKEIIAKNSDTRQLLMIFCEQKPIGEMNYKITDNIASFGIKICNEKFQNGGYGPKILNHLFNFLFTKKNVDKIKCDTNLNNIRAQLVYEKKMNMTRVKTEYNNYINQIGEKRSTTYFEITKQDFLKNNK